MQSIQVLDGDYTYAIDQALCGRVAVRAAQAGLKTKGDWFLVPGGDRGKWDMVYGVEGLTTWAQDVAGRISRFELSYYKEILDGDRIGVPILCSDKWGDLACGLVCEGEVFWRQLTPRRRGRARR